MDREQREQWLKDQHERLKFADDLKELASNRAVQHIIEDMLTMRAELLKVYDDPKSSPELIRDTQMKRATIKWFIDAWVNTINSTDRIKDELNRYYEFEKKKEERLPKVKFPASQN